jgi:hypothetical protein
MPRPSDFGYFQIAVRGEEGDYPALIDISSFLYDFNLLYEFARIVVDPRYARYKFSNRSGYRNARRIDWEDRLEVETLRVESPIALIAVVAAVPAAATTLWALTQAVEKLANFRINRQILKLQRDRLLAEAPKDSDSVLPEMSESDATFREQVRIREADYNFDRVEQHLQQNPVRVREIEITHVRELPAKRRK